MSYRIVNFVMPDASLLFYNRSWLSAMRRGRCRQRKMQSCFSYRWWHHLMTMTKYDLFEMLSSHGKISASRWEDCSQVSDKKYHTKRHHVGICLDMSDCWICVFETPPDVKYCLFLTMIQQMLERWMSSWSVFNNLIVQQLTTRFPRGQLCNWFLIITRRESPRTQTWSTNVVGFWNC